MTWMDTNLSSPRKRREWELGDAVSEEGDGAVPVGFVVDGGGRGVEYLNLRGRVE